MALEQYNDGTQILPNTGTDYFMGNEYGIDMRTLGPVQRYLTEPGLVGDKKMQRQRLAGIASFIPFLSGKVAEARGDKLGEALGYLDAVTGGTASVGVKGASLFLIKKKDELQKTLKTFDQDPILSANPSMRQNIQKQINDIDIELNANKAADIRYEAMRKGILEDGKSMKDIVFDEIPKNLKTNYIYHGGPSGIETLKTPKFILDDQLNLSKSTGGLYSVVNKLDPRLKVFGQSALQNDDVYSKLSPAVRNKFLNKIPEKSVYRISPDFSNMANVEKLPTDFIDELTYIRNNLDTLKGTPYDQALNQRTSNALELITDAPGMGAPSMINKPVGDIFRSAGYDSVRFPPRRLARSEGDTILSLYDDLIQNFDEFNLEDLLKLDD